MEFNRTFQIQTRFDFGVPAARIKDKFSQIFQMTNKPRVGICFLRNKMKNYLLSHNFPVTISSLLFRKTEFFGI